ncbi:MAG: translation initiation factor IF-1 [bacterium]
MDNQKQIKDKEVVGGIVEEALPNTMFRVHLDNESGETTLLTYLSGKMRLNRIRVLIGDRVLVELDKYGGKGKIIKRV